MPDIINGHLYDYPKYYDLIFGSDWKAEFDFLKACFQKHAGRKIERLFEPACGTGRLLIKLAQAGYQVSGNDLNPHAIEFCNARLKRNGFEASAMVGDMSDFRLRRKVDAAFNMINSFRHLPSEKTARGHFACIANCLAKGGLYVIGLHLTPTEGEAVDEESWSARRGNLAVVSRMWTKGVDMKARREDLGMTFDVYTPTSHSRIIDAMEYRTYTARQMRALLKHTPELELVETYDFAYEIDNPVKITPVTEDIIYVLRKR